MRMDTRDRQHLRDGQSSPEGARLTRTFSTAWGRTSGACVGGIATPRGGGLGGLGRKGGRRIRDRGRARRHLGTALEPQGRVGRIVVLCRDW